jgi:hypothetical protein
MADVGGLGGNGGVIVVSAGGEPVFSFNSEGMYRGIATPETALGRDLRRRMMLRFLIAALALLAPAPALAWWEYGHYTVAEIAERTVRPATRTEIARLIRRSALLETPECPVRTLADAAYWPDCIRAYKERFSYSFSWHYQNVDICKPFDQASACRDGNCVSAQIERNAKLLADRKLPDRERLQRSPSLLTSSATCTCRSMPATAATKAATSSPQLRRDRGPCEPAQHLGRLSRRRGISNPQAGRRGCWPSSAPARHPHLRHGDRLGARKLGNEPHFRLWQRHGRSVRAQAGDTAGDRRATTRALIPWSAPRSPAADCGSGDCWTRRWPDGSGTAHLEQASR